MYLIEWANCLWYDEKGKFLASSRYPKHNFVGATHKHMSDKSSDEVTRFYFSFEQVVSKRQTGTYRVVKHSLWEPPTNVYESDDALFVRVEIAGMRHNKFHISLLSDALVIGGVRPRPDSDHTIEAFHQLEIPYGEFRTAVSLPFAIDTEKVKARYHDGFLDIRLPRAAEKSD